MTHYEDDPGAPDEGAYTAEEKAARDRYCWVGPAVLLAEVLAALLMLWLIRKVCT